MQVTALRFFNVYGPAGRPDMMPWRLMEATQTGETIKLFNGGEIHRDWTYIADTVRGVLAALDKPLGYEVINLGCGAPISLKDFVSIIEQNARASISIQCKCRRRQATRQSPSATTARRAKLLGFAPAVSIREGLSQTWDWYRDFRGI